MHFAPSVHDNVVYGYSVDCEGRRLVLYTAFRDCQPNVFTDVIFHDVFAHHFEYVLDGNILFDIEEVDIGSFVHENAAIFGNSWRYAWPSFVYGGNLDLLVIALHAASARAYRISSSYAMSGWVLARNSERVVRGSPEGFFWPSAAVGRR